MKNVTRTKSGSRNRFPRAVAGVVVLVAVLAVAGYLALPGPASRPSLLGLVSTDIEVAAPAGDESSILSMSSSASASASAEPVILTCVVDLEDMPYGPRSDRVQAGDGGCQNSLLIQNEYVNGENETDGGALGPWNVAVDECWAGSPVQSVWLRFQLPDRDGHGWLSLRNNGLFSDKNPAGFAYALLASPELNSEVVGIYDHGELAKRVDQLLLNIPKTLDTTPKPEGVYKWHLGGCWQDGPAGSISGLHFYWT